jgi:hypothetical protein
VAFSLWNIQRHGIGGKFNVKIDIEIIDSLDKTHTTDLKKVVDAFFPISKSLNDA